MYFVIDTQIFSHYLIVATVITVIVKLIAGKDAFEIVASVAVCFAGIRLLDSVLVLGWLVIALGVMLLIRVLRGGK